jgi:mannose-6-phosphate isomerase-like protein (cupin superfamily)
MLSMRRVMMTTAVVVAFSAGWLAKTSAQQKAPAPSITYFGHEKVDASFAEALASATGSRDLFARKDRQGRTWAVHSNSRGKADEGKLHSHEDWTGVVVIMSGAATFITPGAASSVPGARATPEGGQLIGAGESHRVSKGDVVIIPPNAPHMYKNIEEPFRYLVIQTP